MNKDKLKELNIYLGIDTIQVKSDTESILTTKQAEYINKLVYHNTADDTYIYRLNPDKANAGIQIYNYNAYKENCDLMINEMKLTNPIKTRIDFRVDSFDNNFDELLKLNKLFLLLISQEYNLNNRYYSRDMLTLDELCVRVQNQSLEVENYNKLLQEPLGNVCNRLEFRSKQLTNSTPDIEYSEYKNWCSRIDKAITKENFIKLQKVCNEYLLKRYHKEKSNRNTSTYEFLYKYDDSIFTMNQLKDFYLLIGNNNPANSAKMYKKRKHIELFSFRNLLDYAQKIKSAGEQFFIKNVA